MDKLNEWVIKNIGEWTLDYLGLFFVLTVGLAVLLIFTLLIVLVRHIKIKQKIKKLKAELAAAQSNEPSNEPSDGGAGIDEAALRAEIEQSVRAELEAQQEFTAQQAPANDGDDDLMQALRAQVSELSAREEELENDVAQKQQRIDELTAALETAYRSDPEDDAYAADNSELYGKIAELEQRVQEQENELNLLRAENSQIKAQAMQRQLAEQNTARNRQPSAEATEARRAARAAAKAQDTDEAPDEEDEYDEYFNDYGDASSAVKVTLKFDRLKNNWIILRSDTDRTYRRMATKQEALVVAKDLARRLHAQLAVHKKDGKFQKV